MKYIFIRLVCGMCLFSMAGSMAFSQDYSILSIPPELLEDANAVIRDSELTFSILNAGEAVEKRRTVTTLLNDKSRFDVLTVSYDKSKKIRSISATVYDAFGGKVKKYKSTDFEDISAISSFSIYEDDRRKYLDVEYNKFPFTVVFEYERVYKDILDYPNWIVQQASNVSVENSSYIIEVPASLEIRYKAMNFEPVFQVEKGDTDIYRWSVSNLKPVVSEPYSPHYSEIIPILYVAPTRFEAEGYHGDMSNWNSFGKFHYDLNSGRDVLSPAMTTKVKNLTAKAKTDEEKIRILYNYLQNNTRYVSVQFGIGGWQTFDAKYVETNKYGDCKALTNFMKAMLNEAGLKSYAALIYSGSNPPPISDDFSQPMFNHVVLHIPDEKEGKWLECTSSESPAFYLGYSNENRKALLVTPEGGKLVDTPLSTARDNYLETTAAVTVYEDGHTFADVQSSFHGRQQSPLRLELIKSPEENQKEWLYSYLDLPSFKIHELFLESDPEKPMVNVNYAITLKKYASRSGKRIFLKPNLFNRISKVPESIEERQHPIVNKNAFYDVDTLVIDFPKGFLPESVPTEKFELDTDFGVYKVETTIDKNQLFYTRSLEIKTFYLPADRYDEMRDFYKKVKKMDNAKVVLVNAT